MRVVLACVAALCLGGVAPAALAALGDCPVVVGSPGAATLSAAVAKASLTG